MPFDTRLQKANVKIFISFDAYNQSKPKQPLLCGGDFGDLGVASTERL